MKNKLYNTHVGLRLHCCAALLLTFVMAGLLLTANPHALRAQASGCQDGARYQGELFGVDVIRNIEFGQAPAPSLLNPNGVTRLYMDLYLPKNDVLTERPVVIWAFGGGFVTGLRTSPDIVELCNRLAALGYVCASIDYRTTPGLVLGATEQTLYEAVIKAVHDMKAAVRYLRANAQTGENYRLDTDRFYVGGVSAGAITAVHTAYLDQQAEIPASVAATVADMGGLEGLSGTPGVSSQIHGVISLSGAVGDTSWVVAGDLPLCSLHGEADDIVPFAMGGSSLFPGAGIQLFGPQPLHARMDRLGIRNSLKVCYGAGHTPFILGTDTEAYMDTTFWLVRDFLYQEVCNQPASRTATATDVRIQLGPNPLGSTLWVEASTSLSSLSVQNALGQIVWQSEGQFAPQAQRIQIPCADWPAGIYWVRASLPNGQPLPAQAVMKP